MLDPQQEMYSALYVALKNKYPDMVYDGVLPPEGTKYPFIYLGASQQVDDNNVKDAVFGSVYQTIHVYSNTPRNRGAVSAMMLAIKDIARHIQYTNSFAWCLVNPNQQILPDNTTKEPLLHGVLDIEFKFTRR